MDIRSIPTTGLRALIFDVDGTLYRLTPVRYALLCRFLRAHLCHPVQAFTILGALRSYREAQEVLRRSSSYGADLTQTQLQLAAERAGASVEFIRSCVTRWMEQEPLDLLQHSLRPGTKEFLLGAKGLGLRLGVFSDYPATAKLIALGIEGLFDVVVTAQDPEVQRFKPDPRGLQVALRRLGIAGHQALYIGDRGEIDGVAALNAGIRCAMVSPRCRRSEDTRIVYIRNYRELLDALACRSSRAPRKD